MRHAIVIILSGIVLAGCSNQSPVRPDSAPSIVTSSDLVPDGNRGRFSTADAGTVRLNFSVALTVPAYPACALTPPSAGVITGTGVLTVLLRTATDASGGTHIGTTIHGHGTATDAAGGQWVWSDADLNNELFPSGNTSSNSFEQTITEAFHVVGSKGQIMVKGAFHTTVVNGSTIVTVETGNHDADEFCESGFVLTPLP